MAELLSRFSFDAVKVNNQVMACAIIIWLVVLVCTLSSINNLPMGRKQRLFWIIFTTAVPLLGVLCYLPFSFRLESYPSLSLLKKSR